MKYLRLLQKSQQIIICRRLGILNAAYEKNMRLQQMQLVSAAYKTTISVCSTEACWVTCRTALISSSFAIAVAFVSNFAWREQMVTWRRTGMKYLRLLQISQQ
jgi:hypothetical protein